MKRKRTGKSNLTPQEIEKFKALLLKKRSEILGDVSSMENESLRKDRTDLSSIPFHMADMGSDNFELENTLGLMDSERKVLIQIEDALARIEDGTYGICQGNNEPIPKQRLKAIPWTPYCVDCAALAEKGLIQPDESVDESDNYDSDAAADDQTSGNPAA